MPLAARAVSAFKGYANVARAKTVASQFGSGSVLGRASRRFLCCKHKCGFGILTTESSQVGLLLGE
jgi:hypothetical protein